MSTTADRQPAIRSTRMGIPAQHAVVAGLLLAAVLLVVFGTVVSGLSNRADLTRAAAAMLQRDHMDCERHVQAVERRDCKQQSTAAAR